jgi:alkaline phosphatase
MFMNIRFFNFLLLAVLLFSGIAYGQIKPIAYLPNAHSHNDYTRNNPFKQAYGLGFGSIEVDLFLKDGELYVAHDPHEITKDRTFNKLYLEPILEAYKHSADGFLYPNQGQLQLLIDPKTEGAPILAHLTKLLKPHRELFDSKNNPKAVKLLIFSISTVI